MGRHDGTTKFFASNEEGQAAEADLPLMGEAS
jgi:hypothetical protein